jgi:hypothetical protein
MQTIAVMLWSSLAVGQASSIVPVNPSPKHSEHATSSAMPDMSADPNSLLPELAPPPGKATLIGGTIARLDRVQDRIEIRPFGGGDAMKVWFDSRTHVWNDGSKATPRELRVGQQAYVDTVLDGTTIFAKAIRISSDRPPGESRGQIVSYDRSRSQIMLNDGLSPKAFKVQVLPGTKVMKQDKETSTNALQPGALVAVEFRPGEKGAVAAQTISILAEPGTAFTFIGRVIFLDLHKGLIVIADPRDKKNYEVHFSPSKVRITGDLQLDSEVTVSAAFQGSAYATSAILVNAPAD